MNGLKKVLIPIDIVLGVLIVAFIVLLVLMKVSGGKAGAQTVGNGNGLWSAPSEDTQVAEEVELAGPEEFAGFSVASDYTPGLEYEGEEMGDGDPMTDPDAYFFPDSDSRYLYDADLNILTAQELTYARNEIYARHGYVFKSDELNRFFATKNWYTPNPSWSPNSLNKYESANGDFINQYQAEFNLKYTPQ